VWLVIFADRCIPRTNHPPPYYPHLPPLPSISAITMIPKEKRILHHPSNPCMHLRNVMRLPFWAHASQTSKGGRVYLVIACRISFYPMQTVCGIPQRPSILRPPVSPSTHTIVSASACCLTDLLGRLPRERAHRYRASSSTEDTSLDLSGVLKRAGSTCRVSVKMKFR